MRYIYLGTRQTDPALKGQPCDPIVNSGGRYVRGRGNALVRFAGGRVAVVVARRLRIDRRPPLGHPDGGRRGD